MSDSLLLDTHALLWYDTEPQRIPEPVRELLQQQSTRVFVSAVSALELAIKFRLGKLPQAAALIGNFAALINRYGFIELPLDCATAIVVARLDSLHGDPFDRVLAAQALMAGIPIVSRDAAFASFPDVRTVW